MSTLCYTCGFPLAYCGCYRNTATPVVEHPAPASAPEPEGLSHALRYLAELARMIERAPEDSINAHWHAQDAARAHEAYDAVIALRARVAALEAVTFTDEQIDAGIVEVESLSFMRKVWKPEEKRDAFLTAARGGAA